MFNPTVRLLINQFISYLILIQSLAICIDSTRNGCESMKLTTMASVSIGMSRYKIEDTIHFI